MCKSFISEELLVPCSKNTTYEIGPLVLISPWAVTWALTDHCNYGLRGTEYYLRLWPTWHHPHCYGFICIQNVGVFASQSILLKFPQPERATQVVSERTVCENVRVKPKILWRPEKDAKNVRSLFMKAGKSEQRQPKLDTMQAATSWTTGKELTVQALWSTLLTTTCPETWTWELEDFIFALLCFSLPLV